MGGWVGGGGSCLQKPSVLGLAFFCLPWWQQFWRRRFRGCPVTNATWPRTETGVVFIFICMHGETLTVHGWPRREKCGHRAWPPLWKRQCALGTLSEPWQEVITSTWPAGHAVKEIIDRLTSCDGREECAKERGALRAILLGQWRNGNESFRDTDNVTPAVT